jgi:predicted RNA-binding protein with RPS1 domain
LARIVKGSWVRRRPRSPGFLGDIEAQSLGRKRECLAHLLSLVGTTHRVPGTVTRIERYGAFVKTDWGTGLVTISEFIVDPIRHPSERVAIGDKVSVFVHDVDMRGRVSLSMLGPASWRPAQDRGLASGREARDSSILCPQVRERDATEQLVDRSPCVPTEPIGGKSSFRGFGELAAYWKSRQAAEELGG